MLVAELADGIAGYVKLGPVLPIPASAHVLEIKGLSVSPAHRRRGVAKALLHAAIEQARSAGACRITLRVLAHNTAARDLYAALRLRDRGRPARLLPPRRPLRRRRADGARRSTDGRLRFRPPGQRFADAALAGSRAVNQLWEGTRIMRRSMAALLAGTAVLAAAVPARAVTTVTSANGLNWQIHDIAPPKLDTGSIRAITDNAFYGFGGIRVRGVRHPRHRHDGALQRRADARLRPRLRRRRVVRHRAADRARRRRDQPRGQGLQGRQLHALAGHVRQHVAAHDHRRRRLRRHRGPELRHQPEQGRRQLQRRHADRRRRQVGRGRQPVRRGRELARPVARSSTAPSPAPATSSATRSATRCRSPAWRPTSTATRTR